MKKEKPRPTLKPVPQEQTEAGQKFFAEMAVDVLARTLWGEARGEGTAGMQAVANVILNRAEISKRLKGYWWGNTLIEVCQKPRQFSCWNKEDANYTKVLSVTEKDIYFATALRIAKRAVASVLPDITKGATHYHAASITPYWARGVTPCAKLGRHLFYQLIEV
ncbi:MAG: cell wall hydrolase [Alphaproteobacteria bacterium]|nr:cell wall hydrolase [Alphaproteobacteria bacterium]